MKLRTFSLMVLLLAFCALPALAEECKTREQFTEQHLGVKYGFYHYRAEIRRISMESVIDTYQGEGIETEELESIKEEFTGLYSKAKEAADSGDRNGFNSIVQDGVSLVEDFREKAHQLKSDNLTGVRAEVKKALEENKEYLDGLKQDALDSRQAIYIAIFESRACMHQNIIDRMKDRGRDVETAQEMLDDINDKIAGIGDLIDAAQESCDVPLVKCTSDGADALRELINSINDDFKSLNQELRNIVAARIGQARERIRNTSRI